MWTPPFGVVDVNEIIDENCHMTYDRKIIEIADVVLFHCVELSNDATKMPHSSRKPNQML